MQLSEVSCSAHKQTESADTNCKTETDKMDESPRRGVFATDVLKWRYDLHEL